MKTILVTGGAGYIGSHACKQLSQAGFEPVCYDSLYRGHRELVKWGPLVEGDILDTRLLEKTMTRFRPVAVMHFAALAYVGESVEQPALYKNVNVGGSFSLLRAMSAAKIDKLVFSSTCATYGEPQENPITESHPQNPVNPYGKTKLAMERAMKDWASESGGKSVLLRYFNAAGADQKGETGEWHEPETHLIPLALEAAVYGESELTVFGDDYPTPDGTCVRDYIHVTDLVEAHILTLAHCNKPGETSAYNLGNGQGYSVFEVLNAVQEVTGKSVPTVIGSRRAGDPPHLVGSSEKAIRELGWQPRFDSLNEIIGTAWNWHQQFT